MNITDTPLQHFFSGISDAIKANFSPFSLQSLPGFPYTAWQDRLALYDDIDYWFDNKVFEETITDETTGEEVEKYPIKINPLRNTARKHASVLFGSTINSVRLGGLPVILEIMEDDIKLKEKLEKVLSKVFEESSSGAIFVENGILSQRYGGSVLGAFFNLETGKIQVQNPNPREFYGITDGPDMWSFRESWIIREITKYDAENIYGVTASSVEGKYYYIEHWTKKEVTVQVNDKPVFFNGVPLSTTHNYNMVPHVYIPHLREDGLWGFGLLNTSVKGILKEINLRQSDVGDAVEEDTHNILAMVNVKGSPTTTTIAGGRSVTNLGTSSGMPGTDNKPDLFSVKPSSAAEPSIKFIANLERLYRREVNHPAVADGEDEGSQRSSLTLTTRMFPLVTEVELERMFWSIGLIRFGKIIFRIAVEKKLYGITETEIEDIQIVAKWASMLPRDRIDIVNEAAIRSKNNLGSIKTLMGLFGDIDDAEKELAQIISEKQALSKVQSVFGNNQNSNGGNGSAGEDPSDKVDPNQQADNNVK